MKRLFLSLLTAGILLSAQAQTQTQPQTQPQEQAPEQPASAHLTFKGVPIDGTLNEYVAKMKSAGFSFLGTQDGTAVLQGDFAGFKGCLIGVSTLKARNVVHTIGVIFPACDDWSSLAQGYELLKSMLTRKYGEPSACVEEFQGYTQPRSDSDKLHALQMDRCTYCTVFETPKGDIQLSLDHRDVTTCFVKLQYWDRINTEAVQEQAMEDL